MSGAVGSRVLVLVLVLVLALVLVLVLISSVGCFRLHHWTSESRQ